MSVVSSAFFGVAEEDGARFGGDEEDFGVAGDVFRAEEGVDDERGRDC